MSTTQRFERMLQLQTKRRIKGSVYIEELKIWMPDAWIFWSNLKEKARASDSEKETRRACKRCFSVTDRQCIRQSWRQWTLQLRVWFSRFTMLQRQSY